MSKKAGVVKVRKAWFINPKTRVKKSEKAYSRSKKKKETQDEVKIWSP